jgi:hypothetical protein
LPFFSLPAQAGNPVITDLRDYVLQGILDRPVKQGDDNIE